MVPPLEDAGPTHVGKKLPTFTQDEIDKHVTADSLWVTRAGKVYDMTEFANIHPGGFEILVDYGGSEVSFMMDVKQVHRHSEAAYKTLEKYHIGYLENIWFESAHQGMIWDAKVEPLDDTKAILPQIGTMGEVYNVWTNTPVDKIFRLYENNLLEMFSKCPPWGTPFFTLPIILYNFIVAYSRLQDSPTTSWFGYEFTADIRAWLPMLLFGSVAWTVLEYFIHRWVFHWEPPTNWPNVVRFHFLFAGLHHKTPMDPTRLGFPAPIALLFYNPLSSFFHWFMPHELVHMYMAGFVFGFMAFDMIHYQCHHRKHPRYSFLWRIQQIHLKHHFVDFTKGFGFSNPFWDTHFNTSNEVPMSHYVKTKSS